MSVETSAYRYSFGRVEELSKELEIRLSLRPRGPIEATCDDDPEFFEADFTRIGRPLRELVAGVDAPRSTRCRACEDGGSNHADFCEFGGKS